MSVCGDEYRALQKLYGYVDEQPSERPEPPVAPAPLPPEASYKERSEHSDAVRQHKERLSAWKRWESHHPVLQAGADIQMMKHAEADGLRMVAWMAKHLNPGEDPVKVLVRLACDAGWDVSPEDVGWMNDEGEGEEGQP